MYYQPLILTPRSTHPLYSPTFCCASGIIETGSSAAPDSERARGELPPYSAASPAKGRYRYRPEPYYVNRKRRMPGIPDTSCVPREQQSPCPGQHQHVLQEPAPSTSSATPESCVRRAFGLASSFRPEGSAPGLAGRATPRRCVSGEQRDNSTIRPNRLQEHPLCPSTVTAVWQRLTPFSNSAEGRKVERRPRSRQLAVPPTSRSSRRYP